MKYLDRINFIFMENEQRRCHYWKCFSRHTYYGPVSSSNVFNLTFLLISYYLNFSTPSNSVTFNIRFSYGSCSFFYCKKYRPHTVLKTYLLIKVSKLFHGPHHQRPHKNTWRCFLHHTSTTEGKMGRWCRWNRKYIRIKTEKRCGAFGFKMLQTIIV
jgi:hypothetical protein